MTAKPQPLILHVIHHLVMGGMETGLVNLINCMPPSRLRHAVVCVEDYSEFRQRITRPDTELYALHRSKVGVGRMRKALFQLCRGLRPEVVHSRNLSGLDALVPARFAGVQRCVHSEHGWDVGDLNGTRWRPAMLRRLHSPLIDRYIVVSKHLERYLVNRVGIAADRISQIYNGVDTKRFAPYSGRRTDLFPPEFAEEKTLVIGTVGRIQPVKDQATLLRAFSELVVNHSLPGVRLRLAVIGDGPLLGDLHRLAAALGIAELTWLPGAVADVTDVLRSFDIFVLPSLSEGISNTILEAMATGIPIVATATGGNPELVEDGSNGRLFTPGDVSGLARLLAGYIGEPALRRAHGGAGRQIAVERFSLAEMVARYQELYLRLCDQAIASGFGLRFRRLAGSG
jgi:sugar transferase (PEP-CTERM/EpsH1 system associated)